jgi:hypothetical protein
MSERSTSVDIKAPGGITFIYEGIRSEMAKTGNATGIAKT